MNNHYALGHGIPGHLRSHKMRIPQVLLLVACYCPDTGFSSPSWLLGWPFHTPHPRSTTLLFAPTGERRMLRIKKWTPFMGSSQRPLLQERPGVQGGKGGWCTRREAREGCAVCHPWELGRASAQPSSVLFCAW